MMVNGVPEFVFEDMAELELIEDEDVQHDTASALMNTDIVAPYFWNAPAASNYNHHNPYCCADHGLWIHTKMAFTAYERFVNSYVAQGRISEYEADLGRAAILLHDCRKYGASYEEGDTTDERHAVIAADLIRAETELDDRVADAVASHMGPFERYDGPEPETALQQLVHQADMAASTKNATLGVYKPPEKIRDLYPSIPEAVL